MKNYKKGYSSCVPDTSILHMAEDFPVPTFNFNLVMC